MHRWIIFDKNQLEENKLLNGGGGGSVGLKLKTIQEQILSHFLVVFCPFLALFLLSSGFLFLA